MPDWSERAFKRFQETASDERRKEELELLYASKLRSHAPEVWDLLTHSVQTQRTNFNQKVGREFLVMSTQPDGFYVDGPKLSVTVDFNREQPAIHVGFFKRGSTENERVRSTKYNLVLHEDQPWLVEQGDMERKNIGTVAESILDPLVE